MMRKRLLILLALLGLLVGCGADKSDPILFETVEREEYVSVLWEGREYIPFSGGYPGFRGEYLGYIADDPDEEIYAWSGHDEKEWLISHLNPGFMGSSMLLREVSVTDYPNGIRSDYWWNYQPEEDEFAIIVELDTAEDIYVVSHDYALDGEVIGVGGCENADKSAIEDYVYENFSPEFFPENADLSAFSIRFYLYDQPYTLEEQYTDGNHTWDYPVEGELSLSAAYGDVYFVRITGSKTEGYSAHLIEPEVP